MKKNTKQIYFDYAAGTEANPSSIHTAGILAKKKLNNARNEVAQILGVRPEEIIFTSGGTESNNLAIGGIVAAWREQNSKGLPHLVLTNIEHASVLETCKMLADRKMAEISIVPVEENGIVDFKKIEKEIKKNTVLVSVMYANNEIGTIQPIREIAKAIRRHRKINQTIFPIFHTDGVQAANYLDLWIDRLGVDLLSLSGSKIENGGKAGVLYKRKTIPFKNIWGGGDQEQGFRPGTENVKEIILFAQALRKAQAMRESESKRLIKLRDYFFKKILATKDYKILINGDLKDRLPNNINFTVPKIPSDLLVIELASRGVMVSSKSACKSSEKEGSYVIRALREEKDKEIGGIRFSFGRKTSKAEIDYSLKEFFKILKKLKEWY